MSNPVRVGVVAEGWTDRDVLEAAISALLQGRSYDLKLLQPEAAIAATVFGQPRPPGWGGVFRWCREVVDRAGSLRADVVVMQYDIVVLHLDADVAEKDYRSTGIADAPDAEDLPCEERCPPPTATTDRLRKVLLGWLGEGTIPPRVVLCTPSKSIEAWALAALYPRDKLVTSGGLECRDEPEKLLQAKPVNERLVSGGKKNRIRYRAAQADIAAAWNNVREICSEAERFSKEFLTAAS